MSSFDRRLTPARPDLAAEHLRGIIEAPRYETGRAMRVAAPVIDLRPEPGGDRSIDTQALFGEPVTIYDEQAGWAWGQLGQDGYVGYMPAAGLTADTHAPTHRVNVLRSFLYPGPDMKLPASAALSMGALVRAQGESGPFTLTGAGALWSAHLSPLDVAAPDFVAVAERFLGAPYLWGGRTSLGLDCSGLVQVALMMAGVSAPRDTDMMERELGVPFDPGADLSGLGRGDLVFWKGHVGIMQDGDRLLHANGHHMLVVSESLRAARERIIAKTYGAITSFRRLQY